MWTRLTNKIGPLALAGVVFGVVSSVLGFVFTDTGPTMLISSVYLGLILGLLERAWEPRGARNSFQDRRPVIDCPYLSSLADAVLQAGHLAVEALEGNPNQRSFNNEAQFFRFAEKMLLQLGPGDRVVVACAESVHTWRQSTFVRRWVAANYEAARRGVAFVRIMIVREFDMHPVAVEQAKNGISVLLLNADVLERLPHLCRLQPDMGMAVVNGERVYLHWGAGATFHGCFFDSRVLAAVMLSTFDTLEAHAERVGPAAA